jgi:ribosomal protection tetracycline resistance protein
VRTLNLGILAHVDAGKTSLTERLLHSAGVIDELGRVDNGNTQTDSLELERARGITIKTAVASFAIGDVTVNLIDTPGHPDFIAEVERALRVLDGAVLVISAVEGVQAQTRILMRALQRLGVPTLIFINKIDRRGASAAVVTAEITAKLTTSAVAMGHVTSEGGPQAGFTPFDPGDDAFHAGLVDLLAGNDDDLLADYVMTESSVTTDRLRQTLADQTNAALVHPVYAGSAITGAGIDTLTAAISELLPAVALDGEGPVAGNVFKVDRSPAGEKIAYVRMRSGTVRTRDRIQVGHSADGAKVTAIDVFDRGAAQRREAIVAGQIGLLWGLTGVQVGDVIAGTGEQDTSQPSAPFHFAPPTLETVVVPRRAADKTALHGALNHLAEQDPLIDVRQDDVRGEISLSLYGEVQKEVIGATLRQEFGVEVEFRESTTIYTERVAGMGADAEFIGRGDNPFRASVGLRIEPGAPDSGVRFDLDIELGSLPYSFIKAVEETARRTLEQGLFGWQVSDCRVTMTHSGYVPPPPYGWSAFSSSAGDFRNLTPLVLMDALRQAGTQVHEPIHRFRIEAPVDALPAIQAALPTLRAVPGPPVLVGTSYVVEGQIPAARIHNLTQQLPTLTGGEGVLENTFDHYRPVAGRPPSRPRTDHNPLDRKEYLLHVRRRIQ